MQLPILELSEWVKLEIENNPALEIALPDIEPNDNYPAFHMRTTSALGYKQPREFLENLIANPPSLFDHLMTQARYHFNQNDLSLAQWIIGHFNDRGFLNTPIKELSTCASPEKIKKILSVIQTFDPPGVGAHDLQESLLIQLILQQKKKTLAYKIIEGHFDNLVHNRFPLISRDLDVPIERISDIVRREITPLNLHPGRPFLFQHAEAIIPDIFFFCVEDAWKIEVHDKLLPTFHTASAYRIAMEQKLLNTEEQHYLRRHLKAGNWLMHILKKRRTTLLRIGSFLLKHQSRFFQEGVLVPLTMFEMAEALDLHESTIGRAVANKYIMCPQGVFSLKDFFNHSLRGTEGKNISHQTLRQKMKALIDSEDKKHPYSDEKIKDELYKMGLPCARRTVTKYRKLLNIAPASQRKQWGIS